MAWNEPGSSNNKDKDPWTGKSKQNSPPDLEQALRKMRSKLSQLLGNKNASQPNNANENPSFKINGIGIGAVCAILIVLWALWGIFIVAPAEQAVIVRLGKYNSTVGSGLHWAPRFIDDVYIVNEQNISSYNYSAEMLTKDQNLVVVSITIQYRIGDAKAYLFNTVNPNESLKQATASALRQVIGNTNLDAVLTLGRVQIRQQVQDLLNKILARYGAGLLITDVTLQPAKAPDEVKDAFDDAIRAQEDQKRFANQADTYAKQVEPNALGQAQRLLADANAYQQQIILQAKADTAQFLALLPKYQTAPGVTRERMYIDTMENVFTSTNKVLVDTNSNSMFYLPLDKLLQTNARPPVTATTTTVPLIAPANNNTDLTNNITSSSNISSFGQNQGGYSQ